ncbi:AsnC family transcriptional regulator [Bacillus glycinifermentans]|uniref:AsnC family transcriptional regulator n=1 Tax=Bacillus glycinifermentans TaxID=1664069 RepID=A0A0J6E2I8_9BACI|nr:Lrp/AsnC family transcriptional regulator [Bacillus glycinifermentans]ATH95596.1 AsnC family transcriptional regulator [Bacillus glycinifermentans]KMM63115.1 AsnC family transcriptional regulator [Bacillus glycinifermentans]KRT95942.1 AsnC family transcriptional regulator [Bacillus glycinifermentans]MEC0484254.1 Lrp/AsnC family transcriptional regulator [Bacillus glycinifermentans]MEC0494405.1 Lrp/AsnC family transcriptional regulator [Bacillus glycinifermentans]
MNIDELDFKIIEELKKDSRLSMRELGRKITLSAPSVTERVRRLEAFGVIKRYTLDIDYQKIGLPVSCIIEATVKNGEYERFKAYIERLPNIEFCYRIAGAACYMLKINAANLEEVEAFINRTSPYAQTVTHVIFSEIKTKDFER